LNVVLLLDNYDSFTYNLVDYFNQLGIECKLFRNSDPLEEITSHHYHGIVLSPGPGKPEEAGCLLDVIGHYYQTHPMLGICLGHQAIGQFFGSTVSKAFQPMHGKISRARLVQDPIFKDIPDEINVVRYHSLVISEVSKELDVIAVTPQGEIMAIKHPLLPLYGLQFHPEAVLTEYGMAMLNNWAIFNNIVAQTEKSQLFLQSFQHDGRTGKYKGTKRL
jgi:anthranilate synthase/aminodeoxychorismate synthase-like glutamine amidotransferase